MLTSIGRAAARRVVSVNRTLTTAATPTTAFFARPIAVRSLTTSRWSFLAARATATKPAKSASKSSSARGAATKAKKPKAAKKKKAVKKKVAKKPKRPAKKVLTPEQAQKLKIRELKRTALLKEEPSPRRPTPYNLYVREQMAGQPGASLATVAQQYKDVSASERENLARQCDVLYEQLQKDHKAWQDSVPVEDIYLANLARNSLRRQKQKSGPNLRDDRLPRKPSSPFNVYIQQQASGSGGRSIKESSVSWRNLSESERHALAPQYAHDMEEYKKSLDVIRQMAKLKVRQSKRVTPEVEKRV